MKKITLILILAVTPIFSFAQQKLNKDEQKLLELIDKNYYCHPSKITNVS